MVDVLKSVIRALGLTLREVEGRLGVSRGYLTRLFSGVMDLRFDHISEIAEAVGIEPDEILRLAFPPVQKPANSAVLRVREALNTSPPAAAAPPPVEDSTEGALEKELERIVAKTFRKMFAGLEK